MSEWPSREYQVLSSSQPAVRSKREAIVVTKQRMWELSRPRGGIACQAHMQLNRAGEKDVATDSGRKYMN